MTREGAAKQRDGEPRLRRMDIYVAFVSGLGLALFIWSASHVSGALPALFLFIGLGIIAELGTSESFAPQVLFSVSFAVYFATLLLFGPLPSALAAIVGGFSITIAAEKRITRAARAPVLKRALFNMAAYGLAFGFGGTVYLWAGGRLLLPAASGTPPIIDWIIVLPAIIAAIAIEAINSALVVGVVSLQTGLPIWRIWRQNISWAVPMDILSMLIGGGGLAAGYRIAGYWGLFIFLLPLCLVLYAFRLYVTRTKAQMRQLEATISELTRAQDEIHRQAAQLKALNSVISAAAAALELPALLQTALAESARALGVEQGAIWVGDEVVIQGVPPVTEQLLRETVAARAGEVGSTIIVQDWSNVHPGNPLERVAVRVRQAGIRASIIVPIMAKAESAGGLVIADTAPRLWSKNEVQLLEAVGCQLGAAVDRLRLLAQVRGHAQELEQMVSRLQELDRLKSEFMQNASHELRTPLALIRGYVELLAEGELGEIPIQQQNALEIVNRQTQTLTDLVEDITLSLAARARSVEYEPVALDEIVEAAVKDFDVAASQAQVTLRSDIEPGVPRVDGVYSHLRRALDNLLSNAIKFTPCQGTVTVSVKQQDSRIRLQVADSGMGIPLEEQGRIFDRFYQVDGSRRRRYGGMGLGLTLVKDIVEAHNGTIEVESQVGAGSTFTLTLPINSGEASPGSGLR